MVMQHSYAQRLIVSELFQPELVSFKLLHLLSCQETYSHRSKSKKLTSPKGTIKFRVLTGKAKEITKFCRIEYSTSRNISAGHDKIVSVNCQEKNLDYANVMIPFNKINIR